MGWKIFYVSFSQSGTFLQQTIRKNKTIMQHLFQAATNTSSTPLEESQGNQT
jgi:hypothetical protein